MLVKEISHAFLHIAPLLPALMCQPKDDALCAEQSLLVPPLYKNLPSPETNYLLLQYIPHHDLSYLSFDIN